MAERRRKLTGTYVLASFLTYLTMVGLWLLFTSNLDKPEVYSGLAAAAVATVGTMLFEAMGYLTFHPRFIDLIQIWRIPWYAIEGTAELFKSMGMQLFGRGAQSIVFAVRYEDVGDDPKSVGRRALAVTYTTMTPNFVIVGVVREQRLLLYHQVVVGEVLQMTINLGARP